MHISEGVLSGQVLAAGGVLSAAGTAVGLAKTEYYEIPRVALLSAAFFVASLIHVPLGPSSVHLILNGLLGIVLGWASFPAVLVGLSLQAVMFQFGGLTTLGVNTFNMAFPALLAFWLFGPLVRAKRSSWALFGGALAGAFSVAAAGVLVAASLALSGEAFAAVAKLVLFAHLPIMALEAIVTAFAVGFLRKVRPEVLGVR